MRYKVNHVTRYRYDAPVAVCHNVVLLTPRDGLRVHVHGPYVRITPTPTTLVRRRDHFGNIAHVFSVEHAHDELTITASSRVDVSSPDLPSPGATPPWENVRDAVQSGRDPTWLDVLPMVLASPRVTPGAETAEYASSSFPRGRPIVEGLIELTRRIHKEFQYVPGSTGVHTTSAEAFRIRRGVCQDLAHVQLACLRAMGIPARYVSGYLRTVPAPGKLRLVGADQSHAWVSAYGGPTVGWVDVDPTNDVLCRTDHITLAWGRDYSDVAPVRGIYLGGGNSTLTVAVDVEPLDDEPA